MLITYSLNVNTLAENYDLMWGFFVELSKLTNQGQRLIFGIFFTRLFIPGHIGGMATGRQVLRSDKSKRTN